MNVKRIPFIKNYYFGKTLQIHSIPGEFDRDSAALDETTRSILQIKMYESKLISTCPNCQTNNVLVGCIHETELKLPESMSTTSPKNVAFE